MIGVDITVHTLKGIHAFRKEWSTQVSKCSPWGMEVRLFSSLRKKMKDYIDEWQVFANPFTNRSYPSRPNPSQFATWSKTTQLKKRKTVVTRHIIEKLLTPRKVNVGYHPASFQQNWLAQVREAECTAQASMAVLLTQQAKMTLCQDSQL